MKCNGMMSMSAYRNIILALAALGMVSIAGCSVFDVNNGARVENNIERQRVDPYAGFDEGVSTLDGQKGEKLLKGYRAEDAKVDSGSLIQDVGN